MSQKKGKSVKQSFGNPLHRAARRLWRIALCAGLMLSAGIPLGYPTLQAAPLRQDTGEFGIQTAMPTTDNQSANQSAARKGIIWRAEHKWATEDGYNWAGIESDLQEMQDAGVNWVRIAFWEDQSLSYYDRLIPLIEEYEIQILGNIRKAYPGKDLGTPIQQAAYRTWLAQVVTRYQDVVRYWEVENETNIPSGWEICLDAPCAESDPIAYSQAVENYVQLLKLAYETVKEIDPDLQVLIGGLCECGAERYVDELIRLDAQRYFDIMAYHPFGRSPEEVMQRLDDLKAKTAVQPELAAKPIWITAIGFHTADWEGTPGRVSDEEVKADYLLQTMGLLSEAEGVEGPIFWYLLSEPIAEVNGYGLTYKDASAESGQTTFLPAYEAYQELWETKYVQVLPALQDCYVSRNFPEGRNADSQQLKIGYGTDVTQAYMEFDLTDLVGQGLLQAELRFQTANDADAGSESTQTIQLHSASQWSGEGLIDETQLLPIVGTISNTVAGTGYQVVLDEAILQQTVGGKLFLTITSSSADDLVIQSREWKNSLRLVVYYAPTTDTAIAPSLPNTSIAATSDPCSVDEQESDASSLNLPYIDQ